MGKIPGKIERASFSYVTVNLNVNNCLQCLNGSALPHVTIGLFPRVSNVAARSGRARR